MLPDDGAEADEEDVVEAAVVVWSLLLLFDVWRLNRLLNRPPGLIKPRLLFLLLLLFPLLPLPPPFGAQSMVVDR